MREKPTAAAVTEGIQQQAKNLDVRGDSSAIRERGGQV